MRRWVIIVVVLLGSAALGSGVGQLLRARHEKAEEGAVPAHWTTQAPPLRMRVEPWDVGTTPPGKEVRHRIEIANPTGSPWTLRQLSATCSCATATLSAKAVAPGESAWLEVTYRAPGKAGSVAGVVMVEFAEPESPILQVNVSGVVEGKRP
jgi:hypothetical protein